MRVSTVTAVFLLAAAAAAAPAHAAGPAGDWTCSMSNDGTPAGSLSLTETSYSYTADNLPAVQTQAGHLHLDGNTVAFLDGPFPLMGITVGAYAPGEYYPPYFGAKSSEARSTLALGVDVVQ